MLFGAFTIKVPADGWKPEGFDPSTVETKALVTKNHVSANNAIRTRQFWLVWIVLFCNVTAGIGILEQAAPMIQDFFRQADGASLVTAGVAGGFVGLLSIGNMGGRFVWSTTSDVVGRKRIYMIYLGVGAVLYTVLALFGSSSTLLFVLLAFVIISFYGGGFATVPAYLRDLFGTFQVGAIHGRLLTAWSAAGVAGPLIVNAFLDAQGTPGELTAQAYQPALLTMVGRLVVGFVANLLVKPVDAKYHEPERRTAASGAEASGKAGTESPRTSDTELSPKEA
jgi:MFS family permease